MPTPALASIEIIYINDIFEYSVAKNVIVEDDNDP